jgi:hypothetical protein
MLVLLLRNGRTSGAAGCVPVVAVAHGRFLLPVGTGTKRCYPFLTKVRRPRWLGIGENRIDQRLNLIRSRAG